MNTDFIYRAVIKEKLDQSFTNLDFIYHCFNDNSPENIAILENINKTQDSISTLSNKIMNRMKYSDSVKDEIEKELSKRMEEKPTLSKGPRIR